MNKLTRISATVASSVALVAGFAGVAGAASIDLTGPHSDNRIEQRNNVRTRLNNNTDVRLTNNNPQDAESGEASAERNTTVDGVRSGDADNDSLVEASVHVDNTSSTSGAMDVASSAAGWGGWGDASIDTTGPDSTNRIEQTNRVRTTVNNNTSVHITNNNAQNATSGEASAEYNTTVGDVQSGDARNVSTATFEVSVSN